MLPVDLPEVADFSPKTFDPTDADTEPQTPLSRATDWVEVELDLGGQGPRTYLRETNTMPNWAGSSWYQLRYIDPTDDDHLVRAENESYWLGAREDGGVGGVDLYVGGVEHAVLHLLYARFWHKVLFDRGGDVSSQEPFHRLFNQATSRPSPTPTPAGGCMSRRRTSSPRPTARSPIRDSPSPRSTARWASR